MAEDQTQAAPQTPTPSATTNSDAAVNDKPQGALEGSGLVATPKPNESQPTDAQPVAEASQAPKEEKKDYELKLSEGSLLKPEQLAELSTFAKSKGLTEEQAKSFLEREESSYKALADKAQAHRQAEIEGWKQASLKHPEFGGEKFGANVEVARRAMNRFGSDSMTKLLDESGMGNHPEVIGMFYRIGQAMSEGKMVQAGQVSNDTRSMAERFYPTNKK